MVDEGPVPQETLTPDDVSQLLREIRAPSPPDPDLAHGQLASTMTLVNAYYHRSRVNRDATAHNRAATDLERAVSAIKKALPIFIEFYAIIEGLPDSPLLEQSKERLQYLREFHSLLYKAFPDSSRKAKLKPTWSKEGPDTFSYRTETVWHHAALYLFQAYEYYVDPHCRISRDGPAVRFICRALARCKVGHFGLDAIEKALTRAMKGLADAAAEDPSITTK